MPRRDKDAIFSYTVSLPSIQEQKAIASVLSSLDDKIDLLHRQNKTLESMAETLFRQWFIEDSTDESESIDQIIDFNPKRTLIKSQDATYLDMLG
jgi:type I restriction enzyme S subunit